jgi:hypothetical protein
MFATNQVTTARVAPGGLVGISRQGKYFFYMNPVAVAYVLYFSLFINDFNIFNPDEEVTQQEYTTAKASVMHLPGPNPSYTPSPLSVQSTNPQPVVFNNLQLMLPETTMPLYDISSVTRPNVQGNLNIRRSPTFSDDQFLGIFPEDIAVGPLESFHFNQMYPSNPPGYPSRVHPLRLTSFVQ